MKFGKAIAVCLIAATTPAFAADLPFKKNPFAQPYDLGHCGAYFGVNMAITSSSVNSDMVTPGTQVVQGEIGGTIGYGCPINATNGSFWFVEGLVDATNLNGSTNGLALNGPAAFTERFGVGTPLNNMIGSLLPIGTQSPAVPNLPVLPPGVTAGTGAPYLFAALHENDISAQLGLMQNKQWLVSYGAGVGIRYRLSNGVVADTFAEYRTATNTLCVGPLGIAGCAKIGNGVQAGVQFLY
jgi:opacity protein-like surface antigen